MQQLLFQSVLRVSLACLALHAALPAAAVPVAPALHGATASLPAVQPAPLSHPEAASAGALRLRWQLLRNVFSTEFPDGRALARLSLGNHDTRPLPSQGWGIYFNSIDGVVPASLANGLLMEQVSGQLFRLRPGPQFAGLPAGASIDIDYFHPAALIKLAKAPAGPYLAFDDAPAAARRIDDYQLAPMQRPEQLNAGPSERSALPTPQSLFARNANIADVPAAALDLVFPTPKQLTRHGGTLQLSAMPPVLAGPALANEAALATALLARYLDRASAPERASAAGSAAPAAPRLRLRIAAIAGESSPEAYALTIDPATGIELDGASAAGVFRGLQSLREMLPIARGNGLALPAMRIVDAPRFAYRGFQLDVARNFFPKETVFRLLDLMARYKLNKFHFHLADDEGWRLEIAGLPELTAFGARRGHTLSVAEHLQPAYGSGPALDDPRGSGHYRRADYIAILQYASARHIEVIPELEMPGHARAAVKAMQQRFLRLARAGAPNARQYLLHDAGDRSVYTSPQLYHDQVLDPGMASTYTFIEQVVADVVAMHKEAAAPLSTIHVGGDELPTGAWEQSPASQAMMKRMQLADTVALWDYFYDRVDRILKRHGLFASGWEELGARKVKLNGVPKLIPNPVFAQRGFRVHVWNNLDGAEDLAYRLANAGYDTVLAPVTNLYFDMAHSRDPDEPGVHWAAYTELDNVYDFIPFDYLKNSSIDAATARAKDGLTDYGQRHIAGLEGTLFTETVRDTERMDYLIMPRLLGLAERAWAPDPAWAREPDRARATALHDSAWSSFVNLLGKRLLPRLDAEQPGLAYRIAPPGLRLEQGRVLANHQLPGLTLRYTTDGSEPATDSAQVLGPITARGTVRVAAFAANGRSGRSSRIDLPGAAAPGAAGIGTGSGQ
jgi:hexosaminidase